MTKLKLEKDVLNMSTLTPAHAPGLSPFSAAEELTCCPRQRKHGVLLCLGGDGGQGGARGHAPEDRLKRCLRSEWIDKYYF